MRQFSVQVDILDDHQLGPFVRAVENIPDIRLHLPLGRKPPAQSKVDAGSLTEQIAATLLHQSPLSIVQIAEALGAERKRVANLMYGLRKRRIVKLVRRGVYKHALHGAMNGSQLAQVLGDALPLLPPPGRKNKASPAPPGLGWAMLFKILSPGPRTRAEVRAAFATHGNSNKSAVGILDRSRIRGLVKRLASGKYTLTAKGRTAAHG